MNWQSGRCKGARTLGKTNIKTFLSRIKRLKGRDKKYGFTLRLIMDF
jgi:hypothetical protein